MRALILYGGTRKDRLGMAIEGMLGESLRARGWEPGTVFLEALSVKPCVGCFQCWLKTPGECFQKDDGQYVAKAMARCEALFFLSPVTFGGYSSVLKHTADRAIPTISPLFQWVGGEMHHRLRYKPAHHFLAVGWQSAPDAESAEVFARLASRNAMNMQAPARFLPQARVTCILFQTKERLNVLDRKDLDGGLLENLRQAEIFLLKHLPVRYEIRGFDRVEYPELPVEVLREGVVNALRHRDYTIRVVTYSSRSFPTASPSSAPAACLRD